MLTTSQAAEALGISPRRVIALIESGDLVAQKVGRQWLVDENSVERRRQTPKLSGRPKLGQKDLLALGTHTLMCRDHAILDFTYDRKSKRVHIDQLHDGIDWAPLGSGPRERTKHGGKNGGNDANVWRPPVPNNVDLALWIQHRYMPPLRPEAARLMKLAGASSTDELMFGSLGLNLSDQYWFKPIDSALRWSDVNFYDNDYETGQPHRTPDSSTPGALEKHWERRGEENWLLKAASTHEEREPYNELLATKLMQRLLNPSEYVPYKIEHRHGRTLSACQSFSTNRIGFVSANEVATYGGATEGRDFYWSYKQICEELGIDNAESSLAKMIVCDHVMANFDRHRANFGLLRDSESLDGWRIAPLFDHGSAFFARATLTELNRERFTWIASPFEEYPSLQLARIEDLTWYDPDMLLGFPEEVEEVLSANPNMPAAFAERAAYHVRRQINTVNDIFAERTARYY